MNSSNETKQVQFFKAVNANNIKEVIKLLSTKAFDVDVKNSISNDKTALHIASENGYYDLVKVLIDDYHATVNIADKSGKLPLQLACDKYKIKIVKFLLQRNSDLQEYAQRFINDKIVDDLFDAAETNNINKVIELLKDKKVEVDAEDLGNYNRTILEVASIKGYEELVRILVDEYNADIYHEDELGDTAKNLAFNHHHKNIVKFFIERGYKDEETAGDKSNDEIDIDLNLLQPS
ncbi:hypothetical protein PV328_009600 [Microctonus aethiopoides]|uniref:Ankyrin repeat protein n=1 Tax=Microctonus aethiopoides TaxID=144406 RepID=A0AA39C6E7_9HYME|nr:hypothetical protein PV328_009600 [Microctonus aethiopoides]